MPGHKKLTDMKLTLEREFVPKGNRTNYEKNTTHRLALNCYIAGHLFFTHRDYTHFDNFRDVYFDMIESIFNQIRMYSFDNVNHRRSRNE